MNPETRFEQAILEQYFSGMEFADQRERDVFLSYLRGFSILFFDPSIKNIVEIGGGQSTAIFALMAERFGCKVTAIDMNPEAIRNKVRNADLCDKIFKNVNFLRGVSISRSDLDAYYEGNLDCIGGVPYSQVIKATGEFVETVMDGRKEAPVLKALDIARLDAAVLEGALVDNGRFPQLLLDVFRTQDDEFDFLSTTETSNGLLAGILDGGGVDVVFLDSGEFSSLPEWEIVSGKLRVGGYVILHDIFFPKSFKNWLVCASIMANPGWKTIYLDRSNPQGLMVARREI
jgi:predicted O-methyltransferase YrrM